MFLKFHYGVPEKIYIRLTIVILFCFVTATYGCSCSVAVIAYSYIVTGLYRLIFLFDPSNGFVNFVGLLGTSFLYKLFNLR